MSITEIRQRAQNHILVPIQDRYAEKAYRLGTKHGVEGRALLPGDLRGLGLGEPRLDHASCEAWVEWYRDRRRAYLRGYEAGLLEAEGCACEQEGGYTTRIVLPHGHGVVTNDGPYARIPHDGGYTAVKGIVVRDGGRYDGTYYTIGGLVEFVKSIL